MDKIQTVHIISTGGTIEKSYDELDGTLENRTSIIRERITNRLRLPFTNLVFHSIFAKDSLDMVDEDRAMLCAAIDQLLPTKEPIVVLHGTDTMTVSAAYCKANLTNLHAPVIFTGAMRPIGFDSSDALQNVTEAIFAAKLVAPRIFVSFNGELFDVPNVRKNKEKGRFEPITRQ